jgi:hypothetical protein
VFVNFKSFKFEIFGLTARAEALFKFSSGAAIFSGRVFSNNPPGSIGYGKVA